MQTDNSEDEMVTSRILFLSTYDTNLDFEGLIKNHTLGENVNYVRRLIDHLLLKIALTIAATKPPRETIPQVRQTAIVPDG